jgi:multidrug efflux pump subunit AcrA (membrane-fusion protein)
MALFTLADLSQLVVEADVDETYAAQIVVGQPAVLQLVGETQTRPGHVSFVAPEVTVETGGLLVKIVFDAAPPMPVGLTVTANITVDKQPSALSAPRSAIVTDATGSTVFLVRDGTARRTPVSIVDWPAARLLVTSGLAAGDSLIVTAAGLADGQAVTVAGH